MSAPLSLVEVQSFLFREARLLDEWQLTEWLELFADDCRYLVPPVGIEHAATADPAVMLFLVADDRARLTQRAARLLKKSAHAEYPHSRTRHMITNVEIRAQDAAETQVVSYFSTYHVRRREISIYMGQLFHTLVRQNGELKIREKRACLDLDALMPQGSLAFIL